MNSKAEEVTQFIDENPEFRGKFVGWTQKDGLGITRIDDRWYECDEYLVNLTDIKEIINERWINIEDEKPELNTWVFISDGKGTHFAAYMDGLGFLGADGEAFEGYVTHWMPLPCAPE